MISAMTGTAPHRTDPYALPRASAARLAELSGAATFDAATVPGSGWSAAADALCSPQLEIPPAGRPARGLLPPTARARPVPRSHPGRGHIRGRPGTALRDAGRDPHAARPRRGPRRDVNGA